MDYETKILLNNLIEATQNQSTDWWIFGITAVNLIAFIVLTYRMYRTSKKQGKQQLKVQRDNIKLELYDKRYAVLKSVLDCEGIFVRFNYENEVVSGGVNEATIEESILSAKKALLKQTVLSQYLFYADDCIYDKMQYISSEYKELAELHFSILKQNFKLIEEDKQMDFYQLFQKIIYSETVDEKEICLKEMNDKYPIIAENLILMNEKSSEFGIKVVRTGIYNSIDKYLKIGNLDN